MTNADRVLAAIVQEPGLTDAELRVRTGVEPHQQVNQICRILGKEGLVARVVRPDGRIGNYPVGSAQPSLNEAPPIPRTAPSVLARDERRPRPPLRSLPDAGDALVIIPCSGTKRSGGGTGGGPSILDLLPPHLGTRLVEARGRVASKARVDERQLLPAWRRYSGSLYQAAGDSIENAVRSMVVISGGYGLVLAGEPIGMYERAFSMRDWPRGLLADCLTRLAQEMGLANAVAFCAATTGYGKLVRSTMWGRNGIDASLVTADLQRRGGAQVLVPRALGRSLAHYLRGSPFDDAVGGPGVRIVIEALR